MYLKIFRSWNMHFFPKRAFFLNFRDVSTNNALKITFYCISSYIFLYLYIFISSHRHCDMKIGVCSSSFKNEQIIHLPRIDAPYLHYHLITLLENILKYVKRIEEYTNTLIHLGFSGKFQHSQIGSFGVPPESLTIHLKLTNTI